MHLASNAIFDELRLILNFKMDSHNPYILVLSAQPPIRAKLNLNTHAPLRQRILISCTLRGWRKKNCLTIYLPGCLSLETKNKFFKTNQFRLFIPVSGGFPRVINSLATNCLIYACQQGEKYVDEECVYQAANELKI